MKQRMAFPMQVFLGLMVGLVFGYLAAPLERLLPGGMVQPAAPTAGASPTNALATALPSQTQAKPTSTVGFTPQPFVTLPNAWMARVKFARNAKPEIERVVELKEGRITPSAQGAGKAQLLDGQGHVMYEITFPVVFQVGEPPVDVETVTLIFIFPQMEGQQQIRISVDQGEVLYDIR